VTALIRRLRAEEASLQGPAEPQTT